MLILDHMVFIGNGLHMKSSNFLTDSDKWLKQIEDIKHKSFKKIRITGKPKPQSEEWETLMNAKQELRAKLKKIVDPVLKKEKLKKTFYRLTTRYQSYALKKMQTLLRNILQRCIMVQIRFATLTCGD